MAPLVPSKRRPCTQVSKNHETIATSSNFPSGCASRRRPAGKTLHCNSHELRAGIGNLVDKACFDELNARAMCAEEPFFSAVAIKSPQRCKSSLQKAVPMSLSSASDKAVLNTPTCITTGLTNLQHATIKAATCAPLAPTCCRNSCPWCALHVQHTWSKECKGYGKELEGACGSQLVDHSWKSGATMSCNSLRFAGVPACAKRSWMI
mmetsp:Transcript_65610/g.182484  ORF Transcript_65610/g.182484 Transcript_65610/m.182484 type:complete len:207 (+) Transcript_65610:216-836(+)